MKRLFYIAGIVASFSIFVCSCEPKEKNEPSTFDKTSLDFSRDGGQETINVDAPDAWTMSVNDNKTFVTVNPNAGGKGSNAITVAVEENNTFEARTARLTYRSAGNTYSVNISQKKTIEPKATTPTAFLSEGGNKNIAVSAQWDWSLASTPPTWIQLDKTSGGSGENQAVKITVPKYEGSTEPRKATLKFLIDSGHFSSKEIDVLVEQRAGEATGIEGDWVLDFFDFFGLYSEEKTVQYMYSNGLEFVYNGSGNSFELSNWWWNDEQSNISYKLVHYVADTYLFKSFVDTSWYNGSVGKVKFSDGTMYPYNVEIGVATWVSNKWTFLTFTVDMDWGFILTNEGKALEIDGAEGFRTDISSAGPAYPTDAIVYPILLAFIYDESDGKQYYFDAIGQPIFRSPDVPEDDFRTGTPAISSVKSVRNDRPTWAKNLDFSKAKQIPVKSIKNFNFLRK